MYDRLYKKYIPKNPEPIMEWARVCLKEADPHGERVISVKLTPVIRWKVAAYLLAESAYQDMERDIGEENWEEFETNLANFWGVIHSWDLGLRDFVMTEVRKLVSPSTPKSRLLDLIESKPHWMDKEIEDDLRWLINKRDSNRKGYSNA